MLTAWVFLTDTLDMATTRSKLEICGARLVFSYKFVCDMWTDRPTDKRQCSLLVQEETHNEPATGTMYSHVCDVAESAVLLPQGSHVLTHGQIINCAHANTVHQAKNTH